MKEQLAKIRAEALSAFEQAADLAALDALRVQYLGKKGELTAILKQMGKLSAEERPQMGQLANQLRSSLEKLLEENWISNAKKALLENCNLGNLSTMPREEVGKVISSQIEFEKVFKQQAPKQQAQAMQQEVVPVKTNEIQGKALG